MDLPSCLCRRIYFCERRGKQCSINGIDFVFTKRVAVGNHDAVCDSGISVIVTPRGIIPLNESRALHHLSGWLMANKANKTRHITHLGKMYCFFCTPSVLVVSAANSY
jgi:hypothetical protein